MKGITIRLAKPEDAAEIANVHINSWREAYKGYITDEFLKNRPLNFKEKYELWKKVTQDKTQITYVAECKDKGIVGFINGTNGRDKKFEDYVEIYGFYLFEKYHHQKIGFNLLKSIFNDKLKLGFKKGYLWVLKDNPTISFYEKTGGKFSGISKTEVLGGGEEMLTEYIYIWENIDLTNMKK